LKKIVPQLIKLHVLELESCQLWKYVISSFQEKPETRCNFFFDNAFCIWGLSRVTTFGLEYFVSHIDERFWYIWVYLMKEQFELSFNFLSFLNEIKNQVGQAIKIMRSDNAKQCCSSFSTLVHMTL